MRLGLTSLLGRLRKHNDGSALIEFAIAAPVLIIMFTGVVEISRYVLFKSKLDAASMQILDIINQNTNVSDESIDNLIRALPTMLAPYAGDLITPIITHVMRPTDASNPSRVCQSVVVWRYPNRPRHSKISSSTTRFSPATTGNIELERNSALIAVEIYAGYTPLVDRLFMRDLVGSVRTYSVNLAKRVTVHFCFTPKQGGNLMFHASKAFLININDTLINSRVKSSYIS